MENILVQYCTPEEDEGRKEEIKFYSAEHFCHKIW